MTSDHDPSPPEVALDPLSSWRATTSASQRTASAQRALPAHWVRLAVARRRPWWKRLLIGLLLAFSLATTGLFAAALVKDFTQHHWGAALDATRDAVPAAVGWAALILLFYPRDIAAAERLLSADDRMLADRLEQAARDEACVANAESKVRRLRVRLSRLTTAREHAGAGGGPAPEVADTPGDAGVTYLDPGTVYLDPDEGDLDREIAETTARLDQARQWLASAEAAVSTSHQAVAEAEARLLSDFPDLARSTKPAASKPA